MLACGVAIATSYNEMESNQLNETVISLKLSIGVYGLIKCIDIYLSRVYATKDNLDKVLIDVMLIPVLPSMLASWLTTHITIRYNFRDFSVISLSTTI